MITRKKKLSIIKPLKNDQSVFVLTNDKFYSSEKIAAFDIDWTLIKPKKGTFVKNKNNLSLFHSSVPFKLQSLQKNGYKIVVFTNQKGVSTNKTTINQLCDMYQKAFKLFGISKIQIFVSTHKNHYRKPSDGLWELMSSNYNNKTKINLAESFFVGDAAGRMADKARKIKRDFSVADRKFAANANVHFMTPEHYFLGRKESDNWNWRSFDAKQYLKTNAKVENLFEPNDFNLDKCKEECTMIILMGSPASGKTTFAKTHFKQFEIISNEIYRTHQKCVSTAKKKLILRKKIIIDNTNCTNALRQSFVELAKENDIDYKIVYLKVDQLKAKHLNSVREILNKGRKKAVPDVAIAKFFKNLEEPKEKSVTVNFKPVFKGLQDEMAFCKWT